MGRRGLHPEHPLGLKTLTFPSNVWNNSHIYWSWQIKWFLLQCWGGNVFVNIMGLIYRVDWQEASTEGVFNYSTLKLKEPFQYHKTGLASKGRASPITRHHYKSYIQYSKVCKQSWEFSGELQRYTAIMAHSCSMIHKIKNKIDLVIEIQRTPPLNYPKLELFWECWGGGY